MKNTVIMILLLLFVSCSDDDSDAIESQSLQVRIAKSCRSGSTQLIQEIIDMNIKETSSLKAYQYILMGNFEGNTIFIFGNCCPFCNSVTTVYDCSGNYLGFVDTTNSGQEGAIDDNKIEGKEKLWPKIANCGF